MGKASAQPPGGGRRSDQRPWHQRWFYRTARFSCWAVMKLLFRFRCRGQEHFPKAGGALVCANHQSFFDPVVVGIASRRRLNYLARASLFRHRWLKWLIGYLDAIPIERDGMGLAGLKETMRRLRRGEMVLIFPEGTRSPDGDMQALKPGFLVVARRCGVPLVPVGLDGAYQAWPRSARWPRLARIAVVVGAPVMPEEIAERSDEEAVALLSQRMGASFREARQLRS